MALLVVRFSQNVMKNYSIWLKTERETIISDYSDFTKTAPTVPLCTAIASWWQDNLVDGRLGGGE